MTFCNVVGPVGGKTEPLISALNHSHSCRRTIEVGFGITRNQACPCSWCCRDTINRNIPYHPGELFNRKQGQNGGLYLFLQGEQVDRSAHCNGAVYVLD